MGYDTHRRRYFYDDVDFFVVIIFPITIPDNSSSGAVTSSIADKSRANTPAVVVLPCSQ